MRCGWCICPAALCSPIGPQPAPLWAMFTVWLSAQEAAIWPLEMPKAACSCTGSTTTMLLDAQGDAIVRGDCIDKLRVSCDCLLQDDEPVSCRLELRSDR